MHHLVSILNFQRRASVGSHLKTLDRAERHTHFVREGKVIRQRICVHAGKQGIVMRTRKVLPGVHLTNTPYA